MRLMYIVHMILLLHTAIMLFFAQRKEAIFLTFFQKKKGAVGIPLLFYRKKLKVIR